MSSILTKVVLQSLDTPFPFRGSLLTIHVIDYLKDYAIKQAQNCLVHMTLFGGLAYIIFTY